MEGNDAVSRAILMMKYNLTKTLTENIISEQSDYLIDKRGNAMLNAAGIRSDKDYKYVDKFLDDATLDEYSKRLYNWFKTFDTHDWLSLIEISTGVLGAIPTPLSPIFLGISFIAGVSDAVLYYNEGDKYMGSLMLILAIVPGDELFKVMKGSKIFKKRGVKGSMDLIKKFKSGGKLTKNQANDLSKLGYDLSKKSHEIKPLVNKSISNKLLAGLAKKSPKYLINLILILKKLGIIKLSEIFLKIGGVVYSFDKLYLYVFRDSIFKNEKDLDNRTKNELRYLINNLFKYDKEVKEFLDLTTKNAIEKGIKNGVDFVTVNPMENPDEYLKTLIKISQTDVKNKKQVKPLKSTSIPTLNDVLSGKKVIKKGQKSDSVKKIQKMLYSIGYEDYLSRGGDLIKWDDGNYGDSTELSVMVFQDNENLKSDGIVDAETLNKLIKKYKESNNE